MTGRTWTCPTHQLWRGVAHNLLASVRQHTACAEQDRRQGPTAATRSAIRAGADPGPDSALRRRPRPGRTTNDSGLDSAHSFRMTPCWPSDACGSPTGKQPAASPIEPRVGADDLVGQLFGGHTSTPFVVSRSASRMRIRSFRPTQPSGVVARTAHDSKSAHAARTASAEAASGVIGDQHRGPRRPVPSPSRLTDGGLEGVMLCSWRSCCVVPGAARRRASST